MIGAFLHPPAQVVEFVEDERILRVGRDAEQFGDLGAEALQALRFRGPGVVRVDRAEYSRGARRMPILKRDGK